MSRKDSSSSKASNTPEKIKKYLLRKSSGRTLSTTATEKTADEPCTSRSACTAETPATDTLSTTAEEAILNAISALDENLTKRLDEIEDKLSKRVDKLETSIQVTQSEVDEVKKRIDSQEKEIKSARKLCDQSNNMARESLNQVENLERRSRKYNVSIKSKEKFNKADNYIEVAAGIMLEKEVAPPGMTKEQMVNELEVAHPIGKESNQIIVKFCRRPVRNHETVLC